eukprot:gene37140-48522_t
MELRQRDVNFAAAEFEEELTPTSSRSSSLVLSAPGPPPIEVLRATNTAESSSSTTISASKMLRQSKLSDHLCDRRTFMYRLMKWIVNGFNNIDEVEDSYFRGLRLSVNPNVPIVCRDTVEGSLLDQYQIIKYYVKAYLCKRLLALTTDSWTSVANENFVALTAHFIDDDWELRSACVDCSVFSGTHTAVDYKRKVEEMLSNVDCDWDDILAVVTDNEPTMNKLGDLLEDKCEWFGCIDHLIQLIVKPMFDGPGVKDLMLKVRELCGAFNSSTQLEEKLKSIQLSICPGKTPLTLVQDVVTRWWSTHNQVERVLKLKSVLIVMDQQDLFSTSSYIDDNGWAQLKVIEEFLRPFMFVQKVLEGESYVTISYVPQLFFLLHHQIENLSSIPEFMDVAKSILDIFEERFGDLNEGTIFNVDIQRGKRRARKGIPPIAFLAASLDPRTKAMEYLQPENRAEVWSTIKTMLTDEYQEDLDSKNTCYEEDATSRRTFSKTTKRSKAADELDDVFLMFSTVNNKISKCDNEDAESETPFTAEELAEHELNLYRRLPVLPHCTSSPVNPLMWWKNHASQFPMLSKFAKQISLRTCYFSSF